MTGDALERVLRENGLTDEPGKYDSDIHSWRCSHPDRYGPCSCFQELLADLAAVRDEAAREAGAKALEDVADVLMEHHHGGRVHSVEAWVECLCGERLPCEFEGPPFHDPAWDDDAALPSDALALVHHQAALIAGLPSLRGAPPTEAPIPEELWEQEHAAYRAEQDTEPTEGES